MWAHNSRAQVNDISLLVFFVVFFWSYRVNLFFLSQRSPWNYFAFFFFASPGYSCAQNCAFCQWSGMDAIWLVLLCMLSVVRAMREATKIVGREFQHWFLLVYFFFCFSSVFSCETNLLEQIKSVCSCDRMKVYMPSREGVLTMIDVDSAQRAGQKPRQQHAILHCIVYIVAMATFNRIFPGIAGHNSELWIDIIPNDFLLRFAAFGKIIANTHVVVRNTTERNGKSCVAIYDLSCNFIFCALISAPNLARRT